MKTHLRRILKDRTPTIEEMTTILCQIEAVLNSRPLCPLHDNIDDLDPLTSGHFLVGGPLIAIPQAPLRELKPSFLNRYGK